MRFRKAGFAHAIGAFSIPFRAGFRAILCRADHGAVLAVKDKCIAAEPDMEDFNPICASPGLDAATTAGMVLDFVLGRDPGKVLDIASLSVDTVDVFVQEIDDMDPKADGFEGKILAHPLMQSELARQRSDVELLAATPMSEAFAQRLLSEWRILAKGNVELKG